MNYQDLRGFSVVPSWGARIEQAWWDYQPDRMREEVAPARQVQATCIRLWIEFSAWMARPDSVTANVLDAVAAIDEAGMKTMPCLFNRWHDHTWDYRGTYTEHLFRGWGPMRDYVKALVQPLAADPRILIWDLCNEPQAFALTAEVDKKEFEWLTTMADTVRACGIQQPLTVGTMYGTNIDVYAPLCDVLCAHPYAQDPAGLDKLIAGYQAQSRKWGKPLICNECIPGAADDLVRAEVARFYTEKLAAAGFGWMGWALREGQAVSTRRDRCDGNGIEGVGYHPFFNRAGQLRAGLEFLRGSL